MGTGEAAFSGHTCAGNARGAQAERQSKGNAITEDAFRSLGLPPERLAVEQLDLTDRTSISDFVRRWHGPLHMLILNAGVMASPLIRTRDGWELHFATNHLGHFALAVGMHSALAEAQGARVVVVSSSVT